MQRREFIALLGGAAAAWPLPTRARQATAAAGPVWRVGHILLGTPESFGHLAKALENQLADLGYVPGQNLVLVNRYTAPEPKSLEETIAALIPEIDLLVVWSTVGGVAARKLARKIPVVFMSVKCTCQHRNRGQSFAPWRKHDRHNV